MPYVVVDTAPTQCSFGTTPGKLIVTPRTAYIENKAVGNVGDHKPNTNVTPHGMCMSLANPAVAAATAAAQGALTPQPCMPLTTSPWTPGSSTTYLDDLPLLHDACICMCAWAGTVKISYAGQSTVVVDD